MKKKLAKLLICVSMLGLVFTLGACGSDDDKDTGSKTPTTKKTETATKKYASIEDYVNDPTFQAQLKSMMKQY